MMRHSQVASTTACVYAVVARGRQLNHQLHSRGADGHSNLEACMICYGVHSRGKGSSSQRVWSPQRSIFEPEADIIVENKKVVDDPAIPRVGFLPVRYRFC